MTEAAAIGERTAEAWAAFRIEGGPEVGAVARASIEPLSRELGARRADDLALLVTELVTNSYRHSGTQDAPIGVDVAIAGDRVRAEIIDQGSGFAPHPVPEEERDIGGWGLHIVDRIADRWGVRGGPPTRVWFEIDR